MIQKRKIKKVSDMHYLQRRNDALIFVITGVTFLVSNQVITYGYFVYIASMVFKL